MFATTPTCFYFLPPAVPAVPAVRCKRSQREGGGTQGSACEKRRVHRAILQEPEGKNSTPVVWSRTHRTGRKCRKFVLLCVRKNSCEVVALGTLSVRRSRGVVSFCGVRYNTSLSQSISRKFLQPPRVCRSGPSDRVLHPRSEVKMAPSLEQGGMRPPIAATPRLPYNPFAPVRTRSRTRSCVCRSASSRRSGRRPAERSYTWPRKPSWPWR